MKLILINMFILAASLSAFADQHPGAYAKLHKDFLAAPAPKDAASVKAFVKTLPTAIGSCAASSIETPDDLSISSYPRIFTYIKPGMGPSFPTQTFEGIGFDGAYGVVRTNVGPEFFAIYKETVTPQGLEVTTTHWLDANPGCHINGSGNCDGLKAETVKVLIKITKDVLMYESGGSSVYCWKQ